MQAADIMTRHVFTIHREDPLEHAIRLMLQYGISGLPVIDDQGQVVGMLTEGDLLRRSELHTERRRPRWLEFLIGPGKLAEEYVHTHSLRIRDVMSSQVVTVAPDTALTQVVELMEHHRIKRLPVLDGNGQLVGLVSRANLVRALRMVAPEIPDAMPSDTAIREHLQNELRNAAWARHVEPDILVRNGVVDLYGTVTDRREAEALRVTAENVPGVTLVRSHLMWCDPVSAQVFDLPEEQAFPPSDAFSRR